MCSRKCTSHGWAHNLHAHQICIIHACNNKCSRSNKLLFWRINMQCEGARQFSTEQSIEHSKLFNSNTIISLTIAILCSFQNKKWKVKWLEATKYKDKHCYFCCYVKLLLPVSCKFHETHMNYLFYVSHNCDCNQIICRCIGFEIKW